MKCGSDVHAPQRRVEMIVDPLTFHQKPSAGQTKILNTVKANNIFISSAEFSVKC